LPIAIFSGSGSGTGLGVQRRDPGKCWCAFTYKWKFAGVDALPGLDAAGFALTSGFVPVPIAMQSDCFELGKQHRDRDHSGEGFTGRPPWRIAEL